MAQIGTALPFNQYQILVVDDDAGQRNLLELFLKSQGFRIQTASSGEQALERLYQEDLTIQMMISDVRMPGLSGLETLQEIRKTCLSLPILLVTAYPDIRDAVNAMRVGAVNYLEKPIDLDELLASVCQALGIQKQGKPTLPEDFQLPEHVIAESPLIQEVYREAALVASSECRILITGESGVGKEILADLIHNWSSRSNHSFIKVNCAAIPETLLESELFGHEKGAFSGASQMRTDGFEEAHGGTILLDEIAEMSPALQAKLLRVTQDGAFQRLGSNMEHYSDARILTATNRDLEHEVKEGKFREDLFFRLNVIELNIPSLRERREDIIPLATYFADQLTSGRSRLSQSVIRLLEEYTWPGNVRELCNAMERATLMARGELIIPEHLPKRIRAQYDALSNKPVEESSGNRLEDVERETILKALRNNNDNRSETARQLGISRRALTYKLRKYREEGFL